MADCIIWIDQKRLYIQPPLPIKGWGRAGSKRQHTNVMADIDKKRSGWCVFYYAAVSKRAWPLFIDIMPGTRGIGAPEHEYYVSASIIPTCISCCMTC